jgi:hypothetical protein
LGVFGARIKNTRILIKTPINKISNNSNVDNSNVWGDNINKKDRFILKNKWSRHVAEKMTLIQMPIIDR